MQSDQNPCPHIPLRLLEWLESEAYPQLTANWETPQRQIDFRNGQQSVIRALRALHTRQEEQPGVFKS